MIRKSAKLATMLALGAFLSANPVLADDPPPSDGGQDPPDHPGVAPAPLDALVDAWTLLLRMTIL